MASGILCAARDACQRFFCRVQPFRKVTTTSSGAVVTEPEKTPLGFLKIALTVLPGLYIGATVSKTGAAFLEENDIFVPEDDDDDDD